MEFRIGDRIRFKHDASEIAVLVVRATLGHAGLLCVSECGKRVAWAQPEEVDLDQRPGPTAKDEIQQAIREVLLSDEFLAEFAKAFVNAPMPSTLQPVVLSTQIERSIAQEAFEWFKSEDIAIAPITGSESEAYYLDKLKKGEAK